MKIKGGHWVLVTLKNEHGWPSIFTLGEVREEIENSYEMNTLKVVVKATPEIGLREKIIDVEYKPDEKIDLHRMPGWNHNRFWFSIVDNNFLLGEQGLISMAMREQVKRMETQMKGYVKTIGELKKMYQQRGSMDVVSRQWRELEMASKYFRNINQNLMPIEELMKTGTFKNLLQPGKGQKKQ